MANRFTDSQKWDDPWFRKLPCKYKAFWFFVLDKCDHAGIWKVDLESAEFHIGEKLDSAEILKIFNNRIYPYKDKWFISKFIFFQYGKLSEINRVHKSVIDILEKEGLLKVYGKTLIGLKDKDKDKNKDNGLIFKGGDGKGKEKKQKHEYGEYKNVLLTDDEFQKLQEKYPDALKVIDFFSGEKERMGYTYKSDYLTILKWGVESYEKEKKAKEPYPNPWEGLDDAPRV